MPRKVTGSEDQDVDIFGDLSSAFRRWAEGPGCQLLRSRASGRCWTPGWTCEFKPTAFTLQAFLSMFMGHSPRSSPLLRPLMGSEHTQGKLGHIPTCTELSVGVPAPEVGRVQVKAEPWLVGEGQKSQWVPCGQAWLPGWLALSLLTKK